jgi:methylated-DNA-[protein]-cysteine S-methyltransferase
VKAIMVSATRQLTARQGSAQRHIPSAAHRFIETPCGPFVIVQLDSGDLTAGWADAMRDAMSTSVENRRLQPELAAGLQRYFEGDPVDFSDVETPPGPPFYRACWNAARQVPRGCTISYAELAARAGSPAAIRAAGQAMRHNRLPIIVPCHRVIGAGGRLHGFGGSCDPQGRELGLKQWLINLERAAEVFAT